MSSSNRNRTSFTKLFGLPNVHLTNANAIAQILMWRQQDLNFADAFHLAQTQHGSQPDTFKRHFLERLEFSRVRS